MRPDACPSRDELAAFNLGDLPEGVLEAIGAHLEVCFRCEAAVRRLDHQIDPVIAGLRRSATGQASPSGSLSEKRAEGHSLFEPLDPGGADFTPTGDVDGGSPQLPGYEIGEVLGEGGMGVVYKALHQRLNRVVALKMIARRSNKVAARFRIEAEAAARLQHPNIVQIFEIGEHGGRPFLVLEYISGGALDQELAGRPQPPRKAAELLRTLALAADCAHRCGIVHRDLKPSNILLTPEGVPKIADFGVAKRLEADERWSLDGDILGTPRYMAPEQAGGRADGVGPATDVYSLGVILYEMITGRVPHQAATSYETLTLVCEQDPVPPRRLQPRLSRDLETIILTCLRKDPARRYEDARALADDLDRFLAGKPIRARPVGPAERAYKWAKRHPTISCLVAATILGLAAFSIASWRVNATLHWYNDQLMTAARLAEQEADRAEVAKQSAQVNALAEADQRRRAESALYFSRIGFVDSEWRNNNLAVADLALDEYLPGPGRADLRGWEWHYLKRLCHVDLLTLPGHGNWVHRAAFSPDGTRIAAAAGLPYQARTTTHLERPGVFRIWDAARGRLIAEFEKDKGAIWDVDFSPDGRLIASARADGTVCLWDADSYRCTVLCQGRKANPDITQPSVRRQNQPTSNIAIRFSPDSKSLAVGDARTLDLWSLGPSPERRTLREGRNSHFLAFGPDSRRLLVAGRDDPVDIIDLASGETIRTLPETRNGIRGVAYSPDGRRLATSGLNGLVLVWDVEDGDVIHRLRGHDGESTCVAFSPDGRYLASGGADQTVRVWGVHDGEEKHVFRGHTFGIRSVAFSPDGERIATAGQEGTVKVWDVTRDPRGLMFERLPASGGQWVGNLAFSDNHAHLTRIDHDEGLMVTWDTSLGTLVAERPIDITGQYTCPRGDSAFSPDGRLLAAPSRGDARKIKIWEVPSGREVRSLVGHAEAPMAVAFSPDGARIASIARGKKDGKRVEARIWSVESGEVLASWGIAPDSVVKQMAISPSGDVLVSAHVDGIVRIWEPGTGRAIHSLPGHRGGANDIAFSPDGTLLAAVGHLDATVRVWDVATGRERFVLRGHNHPLTGVSFSPDGRLIASVGFEGFVKLWDVETGRDVLTLRGLGPRRPADTAFHARVAFSRDGTRIASNGWDGRVNVWESVESTPQEKSAEKAAVARRAFAWHLREADPDNGPEEGREFGNAFHLARISAVDLPDESLAIDRGHLYLRLGRWAEADADLSRVLRPGKAATPEIWYEHACLRLLLGDPEGYRRACATLIEQHGLSDDPATASLVVRACVAGPGSGADLEQCVRWAKLSQPIAEDPARIRGLLAAAYYRAGKWDQARRHLDIVAGQDPMRDGQECNRILLAMICHQQGNRDEARRWFDLACSANPGSGARSPAPRRLSDRLAYQLLKREAENLLMKKDEAAPP